MGLPVSADGLEGGKDSRNMNGCMASIETMFLLLCLVLLPGCSGQQAVAVYANKDSPNTDSTERAIALIKSDPAGPVPAPQLPPDFVSAPAAAPAHMPTGDGIVYSVELSAPDMPELAGAFKRSSLLYSLIDVHPQTLTGLEQRLNVSLKTGRDILHSNGYYEGSVLGRIEPSDRLSSGTAPGPDGNATAAGRERPVDVHVIFTPGPQYRMGQSSVTWPKLPVEGGRLPKSLADVGLPVGAPAVAGDVLAAIDRVREAFRNQGYPFAVIASTRHILDRNTRLLESEVHISPGAFVRMGGVEVHGDHSVRPAYFTSQRTWQPGAPWNQEQVNRFRDSLRRSGLFQSLDIAPAQGEDASGLRPIVATYTSAAQRIVGGSIKYDSDFGPGVQGLWEHRNITGQGDRLRLELPIWADMQGLTGTYRLPFFLRSDQAFIARAGLLNQHTDAYDLQSAAVSAGIERRFSASWTGSVQGSLEAGSIRDPDEPRHEYMVLGLPLGMTYDNTGNLLDATRGARVMFSLAPYTGEYSGEFSILRSRIDAQGFIPLEKDGRLVLALRGAYGTVTGAPAGQIPPSERFYSGGGGSVRGYAYQSLGPRNKDNDPLGGSSVVEFGLESRWKISAEWGLVTFLDGGMAFEDSTPDLGDIGKNLRWGAGVGLRYYTALGPFRFDVATPLNPRNDDAHLQFYISIGQSF
ncbi:MAG: BamA/TamA family outer membrane protein [Desulfocapsaceae bacterium]|nr:BamA/TamA family outer membrane protein [Desulfocapsaceae bacterium]